MPKFLSIYNRWGYKDKLFFWLAIIGLIFGAFSFWQKNNLSQKVTDSPGSINTINQVGDNTVIDNTVIVDNLDRNLTPDQKSILKNTLKGSIEDVIFISKIFDPEAKKYADQLAEVFSSAGWNVVAPIHQDLLDDFNGKINIFMTSSTTKNTIIYNLSVPAFDQSGITYDSKVPRDGSFGGGLRENTLYIEVGSK